MVNIMVDLVLTSYCDVTPQNAEMLFLMFSPFQKETYRYDYQLLL